MLDILEVLKSQTDVVVAGPHTLPLGFIKSSAIKVVSPDLEHDAITNIEFQGERHWCSLKVLSDEVIATILDESKSSECHLDRIKEMLSDQPSVMCTDGDQLIANIKSSQVTRVSTVYDKNREIVVVADIELADDRVLPVYLEIDTVWTNHRSRDEVIAKII